MKTHRIILPVPQHEAALRGVDRLLLPIPDGGEPLWKPAPCARCKGTGQVYCWQDGQPGPDWCPSCGGGQYDFVPNPEACPYKPGDRLALLERWDSYEDGRWFIYTQNHPDAERFVWRPASRLPLLLPRAVR